MAHEVQLLQDFDPWGNYHSPEPDSRTLTSNNERIKSTTLNDWQAQPVIQPCHISVKANPASNHVLVLNRHPDNTRLECAVMGGSEYPRIMLRLTLTHADTSKNVQLITYFPMWHPGAAINTEKMNVPVQSLQPLTLPQLDGSRSFTFSASVQNFRIYHHQLLDTVKRATHMTDNNKHWQFNWHSRTQPICINFQADLTNLTEDQRRSANNFKAMERPTNVIECIIMVQVSRFGSSLAFLVNMPKPTPCPFPRYDPRYNTQNHTLQRLYISNISDLDISTDDAAIHHVIRKQGWQREEPSELGHNVVLDGDGNPSFRSVRGKGQTQANQALHMQKNRRLAVQTSYFLSEREYEVHRIVGLAREVQQQSKLRKSLFDRYYDFDLLPAGQTDLYRTMVVNEFYIFLNVRPTVFRGDLFATPPQPQTRVTITVDSGVNNRSAQKARSHPIMTMDSSGSQRQIVAFNQGLLSARYAGPSREIVRSYPRSTSGSSIGSLTHHMADTRLQSHARVLSVGLPSLTARSTSASPTTSPAGSERPRLMNVPCRSSIMPSIGDSGPTPVAAGRRENRVWYGTVIPRRGPQQDEFDICIKVQIPDTGIDFGLRECHGLFTFGSIVNPHVQAEQAIHLVMYGEPTFYRIPVHNWLKTLLLAHNNVSIGQNKSEGVPHDKPTIPPNISLNSRQRQAFVQAISGFDIQNINTGISMIMGPPGTGKTVLAAAITYHCFSNAENILMTAGSNCAVDNLADAVFDVLYPRRTVFHQWFDQKSKTKKQATIDFQAQQGIWGVFRLEKEADEHFSNFETISESVPMALPSSDDEFKWTLQGSEYNDPIDTAPISDEEYLSIENWVKFRASTGRRLSLGDHILARISKAREEGTNWQLDWQEAELEYILIWRFLTQRVRLAKLGFHYADFEGSSEAERAEIDELMDLTQRSISRLSVSAWRDLSTFYLKSARVVLCTASTAGRKTLRQFHADRVLVDEAAQLTETETLNAIVRHIHKLKKVILVGDRHQLEATLSSLNKNEFYDDHLQSLMGRMEDSGLSRLMLTEQRRMEPTISAFVSNEFYGGLLTDHQSVHDRVEAKRFRDFMQQFLSRQNIQAGLSNIWFISVGESTIYRRKRNTSWMNPYYISDIIDVFSSMFRFLQRPLEEASKPPVKFAILAYYAEEVILLKRWAFQVEKYDESQVSVITVDASQGREYDYVVLSTCRPGQQAGLGFVADLRRMNVALSRAKNGIVVVGSAGMGQVPPNLQKRESERQSYRQVTAWDRLVKYCKQKGGFASHTGRVASIVKALKIDFKNYEAMRTASKTSA